MLKQCLSCPVADYGQATLVQREKVISLVKVLAAIHTHRQFKGFLPKVSGMECIVDALVDVVEGQAMFGLLAVLSSTHPVIVGRHCATLYTYTHEAAAR